LRAPLAAQLARAQALMVVGDAGASAQGVVAAARDGGATILTGRLVAAPSAVAALSGAGVLAFAGIADADKFFATLRDAGIAVAATRRFADHHRFSATEAAELIAAAERSQLSLVTTEKDLARMTGDTALAALAARSKPLPVALAFDDADAVRGLLRGLSAAPRYVPRPG
jgi:tetraacyldisaccharide 4'-kinase